MGVMYVICPGTDGLARASFAEALASRWPEADVEVHADPVYPTRSVTWTIARGQPPDRWLDGSLDQAGQASYLRGHPELVADYALWLRAARTATCHRQRCRRRAAPSPASNNRLGGGLVHQLKDAALNLIHKSRLFLDRLIWNPILSTSRHSSPPARFDIRLECDYPPWMRQAPGERRRPRAAR